MQEAITLLEKRRTAEQQLLKADLLILFETMQPVNMLRKALHGGTSGKEGKGNLLFTMVGLTAGYLAKRFVARVTKSPFKQLAGDAVMVSVTNAIENHPDLVVSAGKAIMNIFRRKHLADSPATGQRQIS